ncbi:MAG: bifunctional phosphopantothenoylcysteine decarboxylase/phosphopantothenate--cysteine ligase CoaBC [Flavobacteriaceae bacterium]|nr:bifunctional phosphopantothenoylcysteine decarboxylase/phosphopantothenate--cysteine ligase CoaBC [Flavobacteriaceae bacterium]MCY4267884.1 bifunctional phosphopantothenoylcysteine decarboxylase/phosphopantothenate--cysteine ligase CoaBC [Flavobacteriaceae bacterium]MCY4298791.1 bifunctional phosphopantothenoylcysteine decarboxylase/phosphopantothenate--cysteine ligase CoaBC [Flavobacteriaceae bacterium]
MSPLSGKKILLGISGGIAAYKSPILVRHLIKKGAKVKVILTPSARDFVTPLTLSSLSGDSVHWKFTETQAESPQWVNHVEIGIWADLFLIAPATANTLSSMVHGRCNNLLLATYLSARCPIMVAPAMDLDMYAHESTQKNLASLAQSKVRVLDVGEGFLASGLQGKGRMLEPEEIAQQVESLFYENQPLTNKRVLITCGPTYEAIDPVRFIGNHSSGKMGYCLAEVALQLGALVTLISGPTSFTLEHQNLELIYVQSADDMFQATKSKFQSMDIIIAAAAVADFRPKTCWDSKIKKENTLESIQLEPTIDILKYIGLNKSNQYLVGFALESDNELENAKKKLVHKNLDAIVLNSLNDSGAGFKSPQNKITFIDKKFNKTEYPLKEKIDVAKDIFTQIVSRL